MSNPVVNVEAGELEGGVAETADHKKYYYFKGIPYAEPPIGELRFKSPVPVKPWQGKKSALEDGNKCRQFNMFINQGMIGNEDCLYLNVYTPQLPDENATEVLPVMVYIHGGGFKLGSGCSDEFSPNYLVEKDTVVVTMNYRLGVLGFLCLNIPEVPGNAGLRDQSLALSWVRRNIASFGGDSTNITLFGVSAGGASVEYQLLSPMSNSLFQRAIIQSGSSLNPWARNRNPEHFTDLLKKKLGLSSNDDGLELMYKLQNTNIEELITSANAIQSDDAIRAGELFGFAPVVEKSFANVEGFLTVEPIELLKTGNFPKIPIITGFCGNEGGMFGMFFGKYFDAIKNQQYTDLLTPYKPSRIESLNSKLASVYAASREAREWQSDNFISDLMLITGIMISLHHRIRHNKNEYCYMFTKEGSVIEHGPFKGQKPRGAPHGSDFYYLSKFAITDQSKFTENDLTLRIRMVEMWTNFAKYGNPTPDDSASVLTKWEKFSADSQDVLDINNELVMRKYPWEERTSLWKTIYSNCNDCS